MKNCVRERKGWMERSIKVFSGCLDILEEWGITKRVCKKKCIGINLIFRRGFGLGKRVRATK